MGYQRSRQTSTVATLDSIPSSNGASVRRRKPANEMEADKENPKSDARYPSRSKIAVKDKPSLGENGSSRTKSRKNPTRGKRPKNPSSNPGEDAAARKRRGVRIRDGCAENHNLKTSDSLPPDGNVVLADPVAVQCNGQDNEGKKSDRLRCEDEEKAFALKDDRAAELESFVEDQSFASIISKIQEIYSKLHFKYRRLKELKFGDVEKYIEEQIRNHTAYVKAQEELLEHIRMENNLLKLHTDQQNITMTLNRLKFLEEENMQWQSDFLDQHTKNIELKNEVRRLESLLSDRGDARNKIQNFCAVCQSCEAHCLDTEGHVSISQDIQFKNQGDSFVPYHAGLESNVTEQRSIVRTENHEYSCQACGCNSIVDIGNQERSLVHGKMLEATDRNIQPDMKVGFVKSSSCGYQVRKGVWEGEEPNMALGIVNSLIKVLLQRIVGFKITVADEGESPKLIFLHQSSGYSFQLKWANHDNYLSENGELAYEVISFGTLHKVTPDWMKEEIIFNIAQVDVFFDRLLHVVNGRGYHLGVRK